MKQKIALNSRTGDAALFRKRASEKSLHPVRPLPSGVSWYYATGGEGRRALVAKCGMVFRSSGSAARYPE